MMSKMNNESHSPGECGTRRYWGLEKIKSTEIIYCPVYNVLLHNNAHEIKWAQMSRILVPHDLIMKAKRYQMLVFYMGEFYANLHKTWTSSYMIWEPSLSVPFDVTKSSLLNRKATILSVYITWEDLMFVPYPPFSLSYLIQCTLFFFLSLIYACFL